jgi:hypothetical protein
MQNPSQPTERHEMTSNAAEHTVKVANAMSPYKLALAAGKRPQMVYNYIKAGMIASYRGKDNEILVKAEECTKWLEKWSKSSK